MSKYGVPPEYKQKPTFKTIWAFCWMIISIPGFIWVAICSLIGTGYLNTKLWLQEQGVLK